MASWDSYTEKTTPADNDTLMIKDTAGGANKRTPFSGVWNWIVKKLASAVISQLETTNKSIIPAINELNSKRTLKITGVYKTNAISDVNDLPIDYIGIVYGSALHRPTSDGTIYAIFCLGNENDNVKSQFGYTIGKDIVSYVYRNYNYQNQLWSAWKQKSIM